MHSCIAVNTKRGFFQPPKDLDFCFHNLQAVSHRWFKFLVLKKAQSITDN